MMCSCEWRKTPWYQSSFLICVRTKLATMGRTIAGTESNRARVCCAPSSQTRCVYATTNA
jgi:hypothetical protein